MRRVSATALGAPALPGGRDETLEEAAGRGVTGAGALLRVPLDADHEPPASRLGRLDALHQSVGGVRDGDETRREPLDPLVVQAVDVELRLADEVREEGARGDRDRVVRLGSRND